MGEDDGVTEQREPTQEPGTSHHEALSRGWIVIAPVKRLDQGKSRLSTRPAGERRSLALAFALDSVRAALACDLVDRVVVVTDDLDVEVAMSVLGASSVPEGPEAGLNPAIRHAVEQVRLTNPDAAIAVLAADRPALRPDELSRALQAAAGVSRGFVADAPGTGTTMLTVLPGVDPQPQFGVRSRAAHAFSGAISLNPTDIPGLRRDVDTEVDLWDAVRLGTGPATTAALNPPT